MDRDGAPPVTEEAFDPLEQGRSNTRHSGASGRAGTALSADFFARDVATVARDLLGVVLLVDGVGGRIVETEAYAVTDPASHSFKGLTSRNYAMFGPPSRAYVYRIYGIHWCLNFVTGAGNAVLIRAIEPLTGLESMVARRGLENRRMLCSGPGKLAQALGVDARLDHAPLDLPPFALFEQNSKAPIAIAVGPRIGITRGAATPWRFNIVGSPFLSRPINNA